jgi:hypothetical protein
LPSMSRALDMPALTYCAGTQEPSCRILAQLWCIRVQATVAFPLMNGRWIAALPGDGFPGGLPRPGAPRPRARAAAALAVIVAENPDVVQRFAVNANSGPAHGRRCLLKLTSASDIGTAWTRLGHHAGRYRRHQDHHHGRPVAFPPTAPIVQAICDGPAGGRRFALPHHYLGQGRPPTCVRRLQPGGSPPIRASASPPFFPAPVTTRCVYQKRNHRHAHLGRFRVRPPR